MKPKTAIKILLALFALIILFHMSILLKIVPYDITWGGRLTSDSEMYVFEAISIFIILVLSFVLLIRGGYIKQYLSKKAVTVILWIYFVLFALNTVGNVFAKTTFEKSFAWITLATCILIMTILTKKEIHKT